MKKLSKTTLIIGLLASSALGVAACGKKGDVKPPPSYQND